MNDLARPLEAAQAFADARALAPQSVLAQDALAREVEAWAAAKNVEQAKNRAQEYLELYPNGPRASAVRHFGGLQ